MADKEPNHAEQVEQRIQKTMESMGMRQLKPSEVAHMQQHVEEMHSKSPAHQAEEEEGMERG